MNMNNNDTRIFTPIELYDMGEKMKIFVLWAVDGLMEAKRSTNPAEPITLNNCEIEAVIRHVAESRKIEYQKEWMTLLPLYVAAAGWEVEVLDDGLCIWPKNIRPKISGPAALSEE